jgi:hypothetical protein
MRISENNGRPRRDPGARPYDRRAKHFAAKNKPGAEVRPGAAREFQFHE